MTPDKPGKRNDGAADPDASDLDGLIAERDRVRAELERIRREKREAEIELAILKGALELAGIRAGRGPGQPGQWGEDDPRQDDRRRARRPRGASARPGRPGAQRVLSSAERDEQAGPGRVPPGAGGGGVREQRTALRVQARPSGIAGHGHTSVREARHAADDAARARPPAQAGPPLRLVQGRDRRRGSGQPRQPGLPRRGVEPVVGDRPDGVPHPRGQGLPQSGGRLL